MSAYVELENYLEPNEQVEAIVFGPWGWDGYNEPEPAPIPAEMQGKMLTVSEATPLMHSWSFIHGYGAPQCYATYIWTNKRVIWVTQYDGSTSLDSAPRDPQACVPYMPGA